MSSASNMAPRNSCELTINTEELVRHSRSVSFSLANSTSHLRRNTCVKSCQFTRAIGDNIAVQYIHPNLSGITVL